MTRICPKPMPWNKIFKRLTAYARTHPCVPPSPPIPLILAGWVYSNDIDKRWRWEETIVWANQNGCPDLVAVTEKDFYYVDKPTSYPVGPLGGPMYRPWDFKAKGRPDPDQLSGYLTMLTSRWQDIVGLELARATRPFAFSGAKARRLIVHADVTTHPPWGGWSYLSSVESKRRMFTRFRAAINKAIAPHEVDHIDFTTGGYAEQGAAGDAPEGVRPWSADFSPKYKGNSMTESVLVINGAI